MEDDKITFHTKTFAEVCNDEITNLSVLSRLNGFFKVFLQNLKDGTVENPEKIIITQAIKQNKPIAWLYEDYAKEYNRYRAGGKEHCSIHVFCAYEEREKGITRSLFEFRREELAKCPVIIAYVDRADEESYFYEKMRDRFQLNLKIDSPTYYNRKPSKERANADSKY